MGHPAAQFQNQTKFQLFYTKNTCLDFAKLTYGFLTSKVPAFKNGSHIEVWKWLSS